MEDLLKEAREWEKRLNERPTPALPVREGGRGSERTQVRGER